MNKGFHISLYTEIGYGRTNQIGQQQDVNILLDQ